MEAQPGRHTGESGWHAGDNEYTKLGKIEAQNNTINKIRYTSPSGQSPDDMPQHKIELVRGEEVIAGAEMDYFSRPLPLYQLSDLYSEIPGQGNASKVMDAVEGFLEERQKPGVLVEAIMDDNPAAGMYERRGWVPVPDGLGLHVYNWPDDVSLDVLKGYPMRYTPLQDREA